MEQAGLAARILVNLPVTTTIHGIIMTGLLTPGTSPPSPSCAFVLSVERGKLESQAVLLVDSLRRFGGKYSNSPVYAVSPRPNRRPSEACCSRLAQLGVQVILESLVAPDEAYGTVARLVSCAWAEAHLDCETLVSMDDDLFFAREPNFDLGHADFLARPVDMKGMCTSGPDDEFDEYWQRISSVCGVRYDEIPWLETTVDRVRVRASYNGGLVVVRRSKGVFQESARLFQLLRARDFAPRKSGVGEVFASTGHVGPEATRWWGTAQAVLSLAATRLQAVISLAPPSYNVPVHLAENYRNQGREFSLRDAVLVHYHWLLDRDHALPGSVLPNADDLPAPVLCWLKANTPLAADFH